MADDVAHDEGRRAVGRHEPVVPVAADVAVERGGLVVHRDLEVVGVGRLREHRLLERERDLAHLRRLLLRALDPQP